MRKSKKQEQRILIRVHDSVPGLAFGLTIWRMHHLLQQPLHCNLFKK